jgi:hypothetical protein
VIPELHSEKEPSSSAHSKIEPGSLDEKVKVASVLVVAAAGQESRVVSGAVESAGVAVGVAVGSGVAVSVGVAVGGTGVSVGVGVSVGSGVASTVQV